MRPKTHFVRLIALAGAIVTIFLSIGCQQSQQPATTATTAETKPAASDIFVTFEGPWAIVADPKDSNSVIAIAPKTKSHRFLGVVPANTELDAGVYDLTLPARGPVSTSRTFDKGILRADVDPQGVQKALDTKAIRYAIRLPKPDAYVAETRYTSRVGNSYPPDASTEQDYATAVALRYTLTSKTGFQLAGTPDDGTTFKPLLFEAGTPVVRFTIDPVEVHLHDEPCHNHARQAFRDLTQLLGVTLFVDFAESPADCHKNDPQQAGQRRPSKAELAPGLQSPSSLAVAQVDSAGIRMPARMRFASFLVPSNSVSTGIEATFYLFHAEGSSCILAVLVGIGA